MNREAGRRCPPHLKVEAPVFPPTRRIDASRLEIDSDITVRRKVAFLLNALLIQSDSGLTGETSNLPTPGSSSAPAHPNSHASMVSDPSSTRSSQFAVKALEDRGLLQALVSSLTSPVPHGELDGDPDFEEQVCSVSVRAVLPLPLISDSLRWQIPSWGYQRH